MYLHMFTMRMGLGLDLHSGACERESSQTERNCESWQASW